ncbi:RNA polymerase sigma factor [Mangrovibacterium lignilyticum]|uniref:RNA polymerase sigma factor n=1 Tax=Mangrovibacterium lignilyticum TaxID=2668052 RepID=UPI0013D4F274|nr:sigma-70 family RNA polymerase sigma factor [Mangrovibacterium lignilyticum]
MKVSGKTIEFNSQAFKSLFESLFPPMCILASRILKDEEKGKDVAQDAFVKLWQKDQEDFADEQALRAYLYVLVKNACLNLIQKENKVQNSSVDAALHLPEKEFLNELLREETYQILRYAIKELSPQAGEVMNLMLHGFSNQDIADQMGVSINTVKTVKKRAYRALRDMLDDELIMILYFNLINFY